MMLLLKFLKIIEIEKKSGKQIKKRVRVKKWLSEKRFAYI